MATEQAVERSHFSSFGQSLLEQVQKLPRFVRNHGSRAFLITSLLLPTSAPFSRPTHAQAESPQAQSQELKPQWSEFDWPTLHQLAENLRVMSPDEPYWERTQADLFYLEASYNPIIGWANRLIDLTEKREKDPSQPSLKALFQKRLGSIDPAHIAVEETIPFYANKFFLRWSFNGIKGALEEIHQLKMAGRQQEAKAVYSVVDEHLQKQKAIFSPLEEGQEYGKCFDQVKFKAIKTIKVDNQGRTQVSFLEDEEMTQEGRANFEKGINYVQELRSTFPYLDRSCTNFWLYDPEYGSEENGLSGSELGGFIPSKNERNQWVGNIILLMNLRSLDPMILERTFNHEAIIHWGSAETNPNLLHSLRPEDVIDKLVYELQIVQNPDYANVSFDIPTLFKRLPLKGRDLKFLKEANGITTEEFVGITTEYPRNVLVHNLYEVKFPLARLGELDEYYLQNGSVPGRLNWAARREGLESDEVLLSSQSVLEKFAQEVIFSHTYGQAQFSIDTQFDSWDHFVNDVRPLLESTSAQGYSKSKVTLWGIDKFSGFFKNYDFIWLRRDPFFKIPARPTTEDKSVEAYLRYLDRVAYLTLGHAVYHNDLEIRALFTDKEWRDLSIHYFLSKRQADWEVLAEGGADAHYFGKRVKEKTPYTGFLEDLAYKLVTN